MYNYEDKCLQSVVSGPFHLYLDIFENGDSFLFQKIGEVRSLFVQQTRIAATFDCCIFFIVESLKKKIKGQMGWPYAYAGGLTKLQMTKTGLTSFFTSRGASL